MLGQLQRIGKALMLPIATLPAAGLLLRLGQPDTLNIPFMAAAGNAVFGFLPILFAIGVAVGFAKENHGFAGLSGFLSYEVLTYGAKAINSTINLDALGGIIAGLLAGIIFNQFAKSKGSKATQWMGGPKGLAVVVILLVSVVLSLLFGVVWPHVQDGINALGGWLGATGAIGAGIYGLLNRLLIPFGLHHVINTYIWFVYGSYHTAAGTTVTGDMTRFFQGDPTAGGFMAGMFPVMMFGLPGAALAMVATAKPERRRAVLGIMGSAALTSFLTGVTEPIEFAFMFLAPLLFLFHAILTGLSLLICFAFGIKDGFNFSAGLIDYVLNRNHATHGYMLIPIGIAFFVIYFVVFYFAIKMFNIKTPGREDEAASGALAGASFIYDEMQVASDEPVQTTSRTASVSSDSEMEVKARGYLEALGGSENIAEIEACITRLRLNLNDMSKLDEARLKQLGATGVMKLNQHNAQVIVGTIADVLVQEMEQQM